MARTAMFTSGWMGRHQLALLGCSATTSSPTPDKVAIWSDFKLAIAAATQDLAGYGQIKDPAWLLLMECANRWAAEHWE